MSKFVKMGEESQDNKTYSIIGPFLLSFIINDVQRDILFNNNDGGYIETDGVTVWYYSKIGADGSGRKKYKSITTANVVEVGLNNKALSPCYILDLGMMTKTVSAEKVKLNFSITPTGIKWNTDEDN